MSGVGQRLIQRPEGPDEPLGVLGDRLGEVGALRRNGADDGHGAFGSVQVHHVAGTLVEFRQTGGQVSREAFFSRHLLQTAGNFTQRLCPTGGGVSHDGHMIPHIPVVFRQGDAGINGCLTGSHRHVGGVGDQDGAVGHGTTALGVDQLGELFQHLGHFVSPFTATDVDDDVCIAPLCQLVLGHGLAGAEPAGDGGCAALGDGKKGVDDPLSGDQRPFNGEPLLDGTGVTDRPFLTEGQLFLLPPGGADHGDHVVYGISTVGTYPQHFAL